MKKLKTLLLVLVMLSVIGLKGQSVYAMETGDEKDTEAAAREKYWIQKCYKEHPNLSLNIMQTKNIE